MCWTRPFVSTRSIRCSTTSCGDEGYWCPVGFEPWEWHPGSQRRCADVGLWETSDDTHRRCVAVTGTARARTVEGGGTPRAPRSDRGLRDRGAGRSQRRNGTWRPGDVSAGAERARGSLLMHATAGRVDRIHRTVHDSFFLSCAQTPVGVGSTFRGRPVFRPVQGWSHGRRRGSTRTRVRVMHYIEAPWLPGAWTSAVDSSGRSDFAA